VVIGMVLILIVVFEYVLISNLKKKDIISCCKRSARVFVFHGLYKALLGNLMALQGT
jgi:hypothetical protein